MPRPPPPTLCLVRAGSGGLEEVCLDTADVVRDAPTILPEKIEELRTLRALPCFGETDQTQIAKLFLTQLFEGVVPTVPFANRYEGVVDTLV